MMRGVIMNIFALFMALCLTACSFSSTVPEQVPTVPPIPVEPSTPVVAPTDVMHGGGFDKFDDALIVYLRDSAKYTNENFAISPLSLKLAMGMVAEGAAGDTKSEILNAFGVSSTDYFRNKITKWNAFEDSLEERREENKKAKYEWEITQVGAFDVSNSWWINKEKKGEIVPAYKEVLTSVYDASISKEASKDLEPKINAWVNEKTNGLIPSVVGESVKDAQSVLVNTLYLKSSWFDEFFREENSKEAKFKTKTGDVVPKIFMNAQDDFLFYEDNYTKLLGVNTSDNHMVVYALGDISNIEDKISKMKSEEVIVSIPKMNVESTFDGGFIPSFMQSLGIKLAFKDGLADFSNMISDNGLYIGDIIHKTKVLTDEKGIEAAAVTAVIMMENSAFIEPPKPKEFIADKPFSFYVYNCIDTDYKDVDGEFKMVFNDGADLLFFGQYVK